MLHRFLSALLLLLLAGCSTSKPTVASWYHTPPHNTSAILYGVGEGVDLASAKAMALSQIAYAISTTLESRYDKRDQSIRFNANEQTLQEVEHRITTKSPTLHFNTVYIDKEQWVEGRLYVLVHIERERLYAEEQQRLEERLDAYRRRFEHAASRSSLEQFVQLQRFHDDANALNAHIALLHAIDAHRDTSQYRRFIQTYEDRYEAHKSALRLQIVADARSQGFQEIIYQNLVKHGITIDKRGADGTIVVTSKYNKEKLLGYYIEQCYLHVNCRDGDAATVASRDYIFVGKSRIDFSQSHHDCVQQFALKVTNEGIFKSLGL